VIYSLIKAIMAARGLSQRDLAQLLDVSLDRVKSLTAGRVQKLAPAEAKALVQKLQVRGEYLATGEPPIFKRPNEVELERRMEALQVANRLAERGGDYNARAEMQTAIFRALVESLSDDEQCLLKHYRICPPDDQRTLVTLAERLAGQRTQKRQSQP
jgi:transcriptional regulator with XRE-family HTH domain